jgi:hypothetical protein
VVCDYVEMEPVSCLSLAARRSTSHTDALPTSSAIQRLWQSLSPHVRLAAPPGDYSCPKRRSLGRPWQAEVGRCEAVLGFWTASDREWAC